MSLRKMQVTALAALGLASGALAPLVAQAASSQPNILFIMGDDIGIMNVGAITAD